MKPVVVDFESYYDKDISASTQGNNNYMRDSDAYILSVVSDDVCQCGTLAEMGDMCEQLAKDPTLQFWAANSNFDRGWWRKYYPPTVQDDWECVLDVGAFNQLPRNLASLSRVALGNPVDKSLRDSMKGVRYESLTPDRQEALQNYCLNDSMVEWQLLHTLPPLSPQEKLIAAHTRLINRRGVHVDEERVARDKTELEAFKHAAFKRIPWHRDTKPLSYPALAKWCNFNGIPVPKSTDKRDEDCTDLMSEHPALNEVLTAMREYRRANTLIAKLEVLQGRVTEEGWAPLDNLYCAAPHTRRWSAQSFNNQNLDKLPLVLKGDIDPKKLALMLNKGEAIPDGLSYVWSRNWLIPPPGKMFLILDFAQVEPRCLNWLVGNEEMMAALRLGFSYYEAYATAFRAWKGAPGTLKDEYGVTKYTLLKNECLGLGYGMGVAKFINYAAQNGMIISVADATKTVNGFRKGNRRIVQFWGQLDQIVRDAARSADHSFEITMPTGDTLRYFAVRAKPNGKGFEGYTTKGDMSQAEGKCQHNLWGGTLTENVTQRFARDVLAEAMVECERTLFPVAMHIHDEAVLIVDKTDDPKQRKEMIDAATKVFAKTPEWCAGLPLGIDCHFHDRYTKF